MSDTPLPDDELVSAYLDGELGAAGRARVEGDPRLRARAEQLAAVRGALLAPVPQPPDAEVDRLIAAAVGAPAVDAGTAATAAVSLEERRSRRALPVWLSAAAVVAALLLAVPLLASLGGDDTAQEETAATVTAEDAGGSGAGESGAGGVAADEPAAGAMAAPVPAEGGHLGDLAGEDELRAAVAPALGAPAPATPAPAAGADDGDEGEAGAGEDDGAAGTGGDRAATESMTTFAGTACERPDLGPIVYRATARYQGVEAVVRGYEQPDGTRVVVAAVDDCRVLADLTV